MTGGNLSGVSSPEPDPRRWRALAVCLIAGFMTLLDVSIVNVALPAMQRGVGASSAELSWVVSGYALTFGLVLVASGRLGDDRGRKKMFLLALALFTLTSAAAGLAPNAETLVAARLLQGAAGGMLNPQVIGFIQQLFTRPRARAGVRAVRRRDRHLHRDRPAARRPAAAVGRRGRRLALGVLRQRPDRRRGPGPRRPPAPEGRARGDANGGRSTSSGPSCSVARSWRS